MGIWPWQVPWNALKKVGSVAGSALGSSMIGYVDRQAQKRKLRRAKLADLLLALLAARLSDMAYHETYSVLEKDLRSPALSDVPGGLRILHFRRQRCLQARCSTTIFCRTQPLHQWQQEQE